jgi:hypothetical protein
MSQETIFTGYSRFKQRLLPAVLSEGAQSGKINSNTIGSWLVSNGIDVNTLATPQEVADALYKATLENFPKLVWTVKPKALLRLEEEEKGLRNSVDVRKEQEAWSEKVKNAEAAKEYQKTQETALKQINQFIANICFTDGLRGIVDYGKTEKVKAACLKHLENSIKEKADLTVVSTAIRSFVTKQHEAEEAARERMR